MPVPASSVAFADAARTLAAECHRRGLSVPSFRSPPALPAADRTLRRRRDGGMVVAVRVRGRSMADVVGDLVDGVVAANHIKGDEACRLRRTLLEILEPSFSAQAA